VQELLVTDRDTIAEEEQRSASDLAALREEIAVEEPQVKVELEAVSKAQSTISALNEQQAALKNQIHETKGKIQSAVTKHVSCLIFWFALLTIQCRLNSVIKLTVSSNTIYVFAQWLCNHRKRLSETLKRWQ